MMCKGELPLQMMPTMTAKTHSKAKTTQPLPIGLVEVALIDGPKSAAAGDMSISWWLEQVRIGRAPAPAVRRSRCTRWRLSDVATFWSEFAEQATADTKASELLTARAKKASAEARKPEAVAKAKATRAAKKATATLTAA